MVVTLGQVIVWGLLGLLLGFLIARVTRPWGLRTRLCVPIGLAAALAGGYAVTLLGVDVSAFPTLTFTLADVLAAGLAALIVLSVIQFIMRDHSI